MTRKIFKNVFLLTISVFFTCVIVLTLVLYNYFGKQKANELRSGLKWIQAAMESGDPDFLINCSDQNMRVTWVSSSGEVLYDSAVAAAELGNQLDRAEIRQAIETGYGESTRYSETMKMHTFNCAARLQDGTVVRVSGEQYTVISMAITMFAQIVVLLCAALILSALLSARVSKMVIEPINELNLNSPDERDVYQELRPLVRRINQQNRQIQMQMDALQEEYEKQNRMRQEFTANVSHELKTPLTTISGSAEIIMAGLVKPEDVPRFAGNIYHEAQRMTVLVNDILRLSRLDDLRNEPEREEVELYSLCTEQLQRLSTLAEKRGIRFIQKGQPTMVYGVPHMLEEIVYNLCDNAVKYNRDNGTVTVETVCRADGVHLLVSDTGIGVPKEDVQRIFERFYRVDKSRSREMAGTGLGLSIVKHAAQHHQAKIFMDSQLYHGTTVEIVFPLHKSLEDAAEI